MAYNQRASNFGGQKHEKLIPSLFCILICFFVISCAKDDDDTSSIAYKNANITHSIEGPIAGDDEYTVSESEDGVYYHSTYWTVISTFEEWSLIGSNVGLEYDESFFDESALVVIEIVGDSTTKVEWLTDFAVNDSSLIPHDTDKQNHRQRQYD